MYRTPHRGHPARRRRLRHRAGRGAGLRPAGRGARPRRRARDGDRRRDRRARAGRRRSRRSPTALRRAAATPWDARADSRARRALLAPSDSSREIEHDRRRHAGRAGGTAMVRRHNRLLVAFHVVTDAVAGHGGVPARLRSPLRDRPHSRSRAGQPPFEQYLNVLPFVALIVPLGFHLQGLYRLRRGRSRIDDFFNVLVGSIFAVVLGVVSTLYFQAYYASDERSATAAPTRSRSWSGASSSSSTSRSATCRASSCAKRSSGAGARASGCGAS